MSRVYEMTAGAVIDAEGRTVVNGVVSIYDAETGGNLVPPATIRQADGSAWPIEGVKTDSNGKVKALWPDVAGPEPDRLYADTLRGRWPMVPADLSARVKEIEESGGVGLTETQAQVITTAARVVGGVLVDPAGTPIPTGGATEAQVKSVIQGATNLTLPATTTIGGAVPGMFIMDAAAGKVSFATGTAGEFLTFSGGVLSTGGGGGGGPVDETDLTTNIQYDWAAPFANPASLAATKGGAALVESGSVAEGSAQHNVIVSDGGQDGLIFRSLISSLEATLPTPVALESTNGYTTFSLLIRRLVFGYVGLPSTYNFILTVNGLDVIAEYEDAAGVVNLRAEKGAGVWGSDLASPEIAGYSLPGDSTTWTSALSGGWKVLTLAVKQGAQGKLYLNNTVVGFGVDTDGLAPLSQFKLNANGFAPAVRGGFTAKRITIATGMTDAKIATLHASMLASVA